MSNMQKHLCFVDPWNLHPLAPPQAIFFLRLYFRSFISLSAKAEEATLLIRPPIVPVLFLAAFISCSLLANIF